MGQQNNYYWLLITWGITVWQYYQTWLFSPYSLVRKIIDFANSCVVWCSIMFHSMLGESAFALYWVNLAKLLCLSCPSYHKTTIKLYHKTTDLTWHNFKKLQNLYDKATILACHTITNLQISVCHVSQNYILHLSKSIVLWYIALQICSYVIDMQNYILLSVMCLLKPVVL